jgi:outer membrane protein
MAPATLSAAIAAGAAENPSVIAALYVDVAQLQVKIAEGALSPTLAAQYNLQYGVFPQLLPPISSPTRSCSTCRCRSIRAARNIPRSVSTKESLSQQWLNVDDVRDQTRANVVQFWGQLQAAKAQIEAAQRQNDAAERALTGVRNKALAGARTTQEVFIAEQALVNARQSLIVAQHDKVVASYSLLSAVGRLSAQTLRLPVLIYDPVAHYQQVRDSWIGLRTPNGNSRRETLDAL